MDADRALPDFTEGRCRRRPRRGPERYGHARADHRPAVCGAGRSADDGTMSTDAVILAMFEALDPARQKELLSTTSRFGRTRQLPET